MNSWLFPPNTREVQFDEKWSFVGKKEKHCGPQETRQGDCPDHVALDPEHRLVVSVIPGKRTVEQTEALVNDFRRRTGNRMMNLITSDEYKPYKTAILKAYGRKITPPLSGKRGRPRAPYYQPADGLQYATVHKTRVQGRVRKVDFRIVFGQPDRVAAALSAIPRQQQDQHGVCGTSERDRSQPQHPQGPQDVLFFQGLGRPSGSHLFHYVRRQFLLARANIACERSRRTLAAANPRHGRRIDRSRLDPFPVAQTNLRTTQVSHKATSQLVFKERGIN